MQHYTHQPLKFEFYILYTQYKVMAITAEEIFVNRYIADDVETLAIVPPQILQDVLKLHRVERANIYDRPHVIADELWKRLSPQARKYFEIEADKLAGVRMPDHVPADDEHMLVVDDVDGDDGDDVDGDGDDSDADIPPVPVAREEKRPPVAIRAPAPIVRKELCDVKTTRVEPTGPDPRSRGRKQVLPIGCEFTGNEQDAVFKAMRTKEIAVLISQMQNNFQANGTIFIPRENNMRELFKAMHIWLYSNGVYADFPNFKKHGEFIASILSNKPVLNNVIKNPIAARQYLIDGYACRRR